MQGNLNEIDIPSILKLIELGQRTGELLVEVYNSPSSSITSDTSSEGLTPLSSNFSQERSWFIFFLNGQIVYATDSDSSLSRLRDCLRYYQLETSLDSITVPSLAKYNALEYAYLWALLEQRILTPAQGRSIIQSIVHETLFDLLSLHQGCFIFEQGSALAPHLTTLEISSLLTKIMKQVQEWKQLYPHMQSPEQCLAIVAPIQLCQALPEATFNNLERWADGKTSLRQLARYLDRDLLTIAKAIYPFIKHGWIQLLYPPTIANPTYTKDLQLNSKKVPRIVCIDDAITICQVVESILKLQGYEAVGFTAPLKALSLVFQLKPDLILCDIAMPELNGYELCAMLRHSNTFRHIPIVMLTAQERFINRVKARMVGASDYLTKPFAESELLMLVEKHLHLKEGNSMAQQKYIITAS